mmetsp:Transcript_64838/g.189732  ORF Transcript_64838/g.189732 Transcript_64838/m.189732 type:complete len:172 (-) Transcript_64838:317-832(-)
MEWHRGAGGGRSRPGRHRSRSRPSLPRRRQHSLLQRQPEARGSRDPVLDGGMAVGRPWSPAARRGGGPHPPARPPTPAQRARAMAVVGVARPSAAPHLQTQPWPRPSCRTGLVASTPPRKRPSSAASSPASLDDVTLAARLRTVLGEGEEEAKEKEVKEEHFSEEEAPDWE